MGSPLGDIWSSWVQGQSAGAASFRPWLPCPTLRLSTLLLWRLVGLEIVKPVFVPTEDMAADILTKSLMRPCVEKCRMLMGLGA